MSARALKGPNGFPAVKGNLSQTISASSCENQFTITVEVYDVEKSFSDLSVHSVDEIDDSVLAAGRVERLRIKSSSTGFLHSSYSSGLSSISHESMPRVVDGSDLEDFHPKGWFEAEHVLKMLDLELAKAENKLDLDTDGDEAVTLISLNDSLNYSTNTLKPQLSHNLGRKNSEFHRIVERFGLNLKDPCIVPLSLPMDGSDLFHGGSTWESLHLLADCILTIWLDRSKNPLNSKNSHLYLCLAPRISDFALLNSKAKLPFRRSVSELDLSKLKKFQPSEKIEPKQSVRFLTEPCELISKESLQSPKELAEKLSCLEKQNYLAIPCNEFRQLVFRNSTNCDWLWRMVNFGQEVSAAIGELIVAETEDGQCAKIITNVIEVAFILNLRKNFQSFESVMRGLHFVKVYQRDSAWKVVGKQNPLHLNVFQYLSWMLAFKANNSLTYTVRNSLPNLESFVETLRMRMLAIWNGLEFRPSWKEHPSSWLTKREFNEEKLETMAKAKAAHELEEKMKKYNKSTAQEKERKKKRKRSQPKKPLHDTKSRKGLLRLFRKERDNIVQGSLATLRCSLRHNLQVNRLPFPWTLCSLRHIPTGFRMRVEGQFQDVFGETIEQIKMYKFSN